METAPTIIKTPQEISIACESCQKFFLNLLKYVNSGKNVDNPWEALQEAENMWSEDEKDILTKKDNIKYFSHTIEQTILNEYLCYTVNIIISYNEIKYQAIINDKSLLNGVDIENIQNYIDTLYFSCFMKL
jgi:hypothetical protein